MRLVFKFEHRGLDSTVAPLPQTTCRPSGGCRFQGTPPGAQRQAQHTARALAACARGTLGSLQTVRLRELHRPSQHQPSLRARAIS